MSRRNRVRVEPPPEYRRARELRAWSVRQLTDYADPSRPFFLRRAEENPSAQSWLIAAVDAIARRSEDDLRRCRTELAKFGWRLEPIPPSPEKPS